MVFLGRGDLEFFYAVQFFQKSLDLVLVRYFRIFPCLSEISRFEIQICKCGADLVFIEV